MGFFGWGVVRVVVWMGFFSFFYEKLSEINSLLWDSVSKARRETTSGVNKWPQIVFPCCARVEQSVTCRSITHWQVVAGFSCRHVALNNGVKTLCTGTHCGWIVCHLSIFSSCRCMTTTHAVESLEKNTLRLFHWGKFGKELQDFFLFTASKFRQQQTLQSPQPFQNRSWETGYGI